MPLKRRVSGKGGPAASAGPRKGEKRSRPDADLLQWGSKDDADVSSEEEDESKQGRNTGSDDEDSADERERTETAEEKRLRLAKDYLMRLGADGEGVASDSDAESEGEDGVVNKGVSEDKLSRRLEQERLESKGQLHRDLALQLRDTDLSTVQLRHYTGHKLAVTCVALTGDDSTAFSGSKDNSVLKWDVETGHRTQLCARWSKKLPGGAKNTVQAHSNEVLAVTVSTDGRYLVAGGRDKLVRVWDCRTDEMIETFTGHRDAVSCLAFRHNSYSLYSGSFDRCIKHWSLAEMSYLETLFGHQSEINAIDAFRRERAVTGSRDNTVRAWKILEETHLVFRPTGGGSIDAVACLDDEWFLSGGEDGSLALWYSLKKKPAAVVHNAHASGSHSYAPWICSLAAARSSDLAVSGSSDGFVRFWHCDTTARSLTQVNSVAVAGCVNGLCVASSGKFVVAAVGQEHKLGRWEKHKAAKNEVCIIPIAAAADSISDTAQQQQQQQQHNGLQNGRHHAADDDDDALQDVDGTEE
eukprot:17209-Heterococcus_DN1.PRE.3